jgi:putative transposase
MVTVNRLGLPAPPRRSLACTNGIENMMGTVRRVCHNVKEATKGFRRLRAYRQLPILKAALVAHASKHTITKKIEPQADAA